MSKQVCVRLDEELYRAVQVAAQAAGWSFSEYVRDLLYEGLHERGVGLNATEAETTQVGGIPFG